MPNKLPDNTKYFLILLAIVLIAIALRLYCFGGYVGLDDAEYARFAHQIAQGDFTLGTYNGPAVFPLRVGNIYPVSVLFRFFGVTDWTMVFYPFSLSILNILLAYFCTKYFFGSRAGLIAAALWAVLPIELNNATKLLPDLPSAFYASLGVTCILFLIRFSTQRKSLLLFGGVLAGLSFGLSWLCKTTVVYLVPFCIALLIMTLKANRERNISLWIGVAAGSLGVLLIEMATYYNFMGDWLFRFHEIERNYLQWENGFFTEGSIYGYPAGCSYSKALVKRLFLTGPKSILLDSQFLFLPSLGLIGSFHALYWKDKSFFIPALWLMTLFLMFNFSSSSFSSYTPLALLNRYLYPIYFPAIILTAGFLEKLASCRPENERIEIYKERVFWAVILAAFIVLIGGYQTFREIRDTGNKAAWTSELRVVSNNVKPEERFYTDPISKKGLEFFWRYPDKINVIDFEGMKSPKDILSGSFVLTNRWYVDWLNVNAGMWLSDPSGYRKPDFFDHPPHSWKTIWKNTNAALYYVE